MRVFLLKRLIFLEKGKNWHSFVFKVLQVHTKIKSTDMYHVAKWLSPEV